MYVAQPEWRSLRTDTAAAFRRPNKPQVPSAEATGRGDVLMKGSDHGKRRKTRNLLDHPSSTAKPSDAFRDDPLADTRPLTAPEAPAGVIAASFLIRSAVGGAAAVMTGHRLGRRDCDGHRRKPAQAKPGRRLDAAARGGPECRQEGKGPVLTTVDEFYKVGPGPSSSHTIGPMRITYDFYQRATKLPADKLAKATKLQVNLFGSLSATARDTARNEPRSRGWSGKNRQRSTRNSSTACGQA